MSVRLVTTSLLPPCRAIHVAASSSACALRSRAPRPPPSSVGRAGVRWLAATPPPPEFPGQTPSELPGTDRPPLEVPGTNRPPQEVPSIDTPPEFDAPPGVDDVLMPGAPGPGPELPGPAMPSPPAPEVPNVPTNPDVPPPQPPDVDPPRPPPEVVPPEPPGATTVLPPLV
ncbi:unnamed protein product [Urochloa humidicola]